MAGRPYGYRPRSRDSHLTCEKRLVTSAITQLLRNGLARRHVRTGVLLLMHISPVSPTIYNTTRVLGSAYIGSRRIYAINRLNLSRRCASKIRHLVLSPTCLSDPHLAGSSRQRRARRRSTSCASLLGILLPACRRTILSQMLETAILISERFGK